MKTSETNIVSPWLTIREASAYVRRGKRFLAREAQEGRLRAAPVGRRRELMFRREWLDEHLELPATPVEVGRRRPA